MKLEYSFYQLFPNIYLIEVNNETEIKSIFHEINASHANSHILRIIMEDTNYIYHDFIKSIYESCEYLSKSDNFYLIGVTKNERKNIDKYLTYAFYDTNMIYRQEMNKIVGDIPMSALGDVSTMWEFQSRLVYPEQADEKLAPYIKLAQKSFKKVKGKWSLSQPLIKKKIININQQNLF